LGPRPGLDAVVRRNVLRVSGVITFEWSRMVKLFRVTLTPENGIIVTK